MGRINKLIVAAGPPLAGAVLEHLFHLLLLPEPGIQAGAPHRLQATKNNRRYRRSGGTQEAFSTSKPGTLLLDGASSTEGADALACSESLLWFREAPQVVCLASVTLFLSTLRHKTLSSPTLCSVNPEKRPHPPGKNRTVSCK